MRQCVPISRTEMVRRVCSQNWELGSGLVQGASNFLIAQLISV